MSGERSHPPRLATWMLLHLCPTKDREALTGDLFERFLEVRSVGWFWRQVLIAIFVGILKEVSARWPHIVFAAAGTVVLVSSYSFVYLNRVPAFARLSSWSMGLPFPLSVAFLFGFRLFVRALMVLPILGVFLLLTGTFDWARMARAFLGTLALLSIGNLAALCIVSDMYPNQDLAVAIALLVVGAGSYFPLLICAWIACPLPSGPRNPAP